MGVSIEQYRQRIGCFARVARVLSSLKVRGYNIKTALRIIIRLSCLVVLVAALIPSSLFVLDLTQFGDVEKNPGPANYKFHLIRYDEFEELAAIVLKETYKIPFLIFKNGKDGGRDAVAGNTNIDLGGGNVLTNQNVVVQVKHTENESATLNDGTRNRVFGKEKKNVKRLVDDDELDIYIIVTNYKLPAGQRFELQKLFKKVGAKVVIVVGYETLSLWLNSSPELKNKVCRLFPAVDDSNSTSESCESPPPKRQRLQPDDNGDNIKVLTEILSDEYKSRASRVHPLPWLDTTRLELDKIYTRLGIVQRENDRSKLTNKTVELSDIFDKHEYTMCEHPRTILIEGSPGMGKTTLSLKIAYEWAMGRMPSKFPPVQLVLLIKCWDMKGDILEAIYKQLLSLDEVSLQNKLHTFIQKHPEKILLVVDGLDEITEAAAEHVMNLLKGKCLRKCYVVATSRQDKGLKVREYFDTLLEIKGYSNNDTKEYITKYFQNNEPSFAKRLIKNLEKDINIRTLATNPLNTALLCVVFEDFQGKLPSTVTELYDNIVSIITKRYCKNWCLEDSLLESSKETLGRLAYKGLLEDALCFRESELNDDASNHCTKMGFLYKKDSKQKINPDHTYWFLHKTFQEYLSAFYLTEKVKRQGLTVGDMIDKLKDTERFTQVLKFVSGMLHKNDAVHHKEFVEKVGKWILEEERQNNCRTLNQNNCRTLNFLCANILSECSVDKDIAGIIHQFLPGGLLFDSMNRRFENVDAVLRIMPRLLNQICTKDGVNKEVCIGHFILSRKVITASQLTLICKALTEKLKVTRLLFYTSAVVDDEKKRHCNVQPSFTTKSTKILENALCQGCNLEELCFFQISLPDNEAIIAALTPGPLSTYMAAGRRGTVLHTLILQSTGCDEQSAFAAAKLLRTTNTLKILEMSNSSLGSKGVTYIADALKSNRTLYYLCLTSTACGDKGVVSLANMLCCNETLTTLTLSNFDDVKEGNSNYNEVGDDGAVALADALQVNNSLKLLHFRDNGITNKGFKYFGKALLKNTNLEELCVNRPGDASAALDQDMSETVNVNNCGCTMKDEYYK